MVFVHRFSICSSAQSPIFSMNRRLQPHETFIFSWWNHHFHLCSYKKPPYFSWFHIVQPCSTMIFRYKPVPCCPVPRSRWCPQRAGCADPSQGRVSGCWAPRGSWAKRVHLSGRNVGKIKGLWWWLLWDVYHGDLWIFMVIYGKCSTIWVNYNNSLIWNKAIWGWFP